MEEFPDEEFDDETRSAVVADLRRRVRSPSTSTSSSSGTARPKERDIPRHSVIPIHSPKGPHVGSSGLVQAMSDADSQLSGLTVTEGLAGPDGTLLDWVIHTGSKCPASVKVTAGPFDHEDFVRLHVDKTEVWIEISCLASCDLDLCHRSLTTSSTSKIRVWIRER